LITGFPLLTTDRFFKNLFPTNQAFASLAGARALRKYEPRVQRFNRFLPFPDMTKIVDSSGLEFNFLYLSLPPRNQKWFGRNTFLITNTRK